MVPFLGHIDIESSNSAFPYLIQIRHTFNFYAKQKIISNSQQNLYSFHSVKYSLHMDQSTFSPDDFLPLFKNWSKK